MNRLITILLLCLLLLTACGGDSDSTADQETVPATATTETVPSAADEPTVEPVEPADVQMSAENVRLFSTFLDEENIVPGLSQRQMKDQMKQYSYEGEPFDADNGVFWDGTGGGGFNGGDRDLGFSNSFQKDLETNQVNYFNEFHTRLQLDDFSMPFDLAFQDEMGQVMEKMGLEFDPVESFAGRTDGEKKLSLYQSDRESVVIEDCRQLERSLCAFYILYTETYTDTDLRTNPVTVTRTVILRFAHETYVLDNIQLKVNEYYLSN